jgi:hypothetical protein
MAIRKVFERLNPGDREPSDLADNIDPDLSLSENLANLEKLFPVYRWRRREEEALTGREIREREREEEAIERLYKKYLADIGALPAP